MPITLFEKDEIGLLVCQGANDLNIYSFSIKRPKGAEMLSATIENAFGDTEQNGEACQRE